MALRLQRAWRALLLAAPRDPFHGEAWIVTGAVGRDRRLATALEVTTQGKIIRPFYATRKAFWQGMPRPLNDDWAMRWMDVDDLLSKVESALPAILPSLSERSFAAIADKSSSFGYPTSSGRPSASSLPKGAGKAEFGNRVLKLTPNLAGDPFAGGLACPPGWSISTRTESDWRPRQDPVPRVQQHGEPGKDEAPRFEYLAETLARETIPCPSRHLEARRVRGPGTPGISMGQWSVPVNAEVIGVARRPL